MAIPQTSSMSRGPTPAPTHAAPATGFDDVTYDLISVQYHSLKAGHDYGQYVRDAENAGKDDIAKFFLDKGYKIGGQFFNARQDVTIYPDVGQRQYYRVAQELAGLEAGEATPGAFERAVEAAKVTEVSTAFSIPTFNEDAWHRSEPGTPHPRKRMEAVAKLNEAGIPCGVMLAPILPGITDAEADMRAVVEAAIDAGATHVSPILLHLRPVVKDVYMEWLKDNYPDLVPRYKKMYPGSYASKDEQKTLGSTVRHLIDSAGGLKPKFPMPSWRRREERKPGPAPTKQLTLL